MWRGPWTAWPFGAPPPSFLRMIMRGEGSESCLVVGIARALVRRENEFLFRHCEEPTGPARSGRPDDRLRNPGEGAYPRVWAKRDPPHPNSHPPRDRTRGEGARIAPREGMRLSFPASRGRMKPRFNPSAPLQRIINEGME